MTKPVKSVLIVGRDASAWLAACALSRALGPAGISVAVLELPSLLRPYDVYATLPPLEAFHQLLGLDEAELLRRCGGTYSLGQSFANFARNRPAFFHPYSSSGVSIDRLPFLQHWIKARKAGMNVPYEDFAINAVAAKQGRFFVADEEIMAFARADYGYHLRATPYIQTLRAIAEARGVTIIPGRLVDIRRDAQSGDITSLLLGDGREVEADLYIDATGTESLLLGGAMQVEQTAWPWFVCDRILTAGASRLNTVPAYGQVRAMSDGYLTLSPLQDMTGISYAYFSNAVKDEEALQQAAVVTGLRVSDATVDVHKAGMRNAFWVGNCVGLGEAACVADPIDNVTLHLTQLGLAFLIDLFPLTTASQPERDEYNANLREAFENIRDFQLTHNLLNGNVDMPYWDAVRGMPLPLRLAYRLEAFEARGLLPSYDNETFLPDSWAASFLGHGLMPRAFDPAVDLTPDQKAIQNVQHLLGTLRGHVEKMPTLQAYIANHVSAPAPAAVSFSF